MKLIDSFNREHNYLRISLTDKCNFNCIYCNPFNRKPKTERDEILNFEEILRIIELFAGRLEFKKFRFTGGEPLTRKGIFDFFKEVGKLKNKYGFTTGLTTNGSLLKGKVSALKKNSIDNLNISIDSLNRNRFVKITQKDELNSIIEIIEECIAGGFNPLKINIVVIKGINGDEILNFIDFFKEMNIKIRFIEFMPFGSNEWERNEFISYKDMRAIVKSKYRLKAIKPQKYAVAKDFILEGYPAEISFISSISNDFCSTCNRLRISSDGKLRLCLFMEGMYGINFKQMFKDNYTDGTIINLVQKALYLKWEKHPEIEELSKLTKNNMMTIGG